MKRKLLKRLWVMLLVFIVGISTPNRVLATEKSLDNSNQITATLTESENKAVSDTINPNESKTFTVHLNLYLGFSKDFMIRATSNATAGMLIVHLYNPLGFMVSNDWMMGINETVKWTIPSPPVGNWKLVVASNCPDGPVKIVAKWAD